ncbi:hypothetical protein [Natrinema sp. SYSU A 869]|nr:hypothetical protein [Natrinema sp. SYSU A 869]
MSRESALERDDEPRADGDEPAGDSEGDRAELQAASQRSVSTVSSVANG